MINFAISLGSILGILQFILGIAYLISTIILLVRRSNQMSGLAVFLYLAQAIIALIFLPLGGIILIFQGWRLDPILQFQQLILTAFIIYIGIKDTLIDFIERGR